MRLGLDAVVDPRVSGQRDCCSVRFAPPAALRRLSPGSVFGNEKHKSHEQEG